MYIKMQHVKHLLLQLTALQFLSGCLSAYQYWYINDKSVSVVNISSSKISVSACLFPFITVTFHFKVGNVLVFFCFLHFKLDFLKSSIWLVVSLFLLSFSELLLQNMQQFSKTADVFLNSFMCLLALYITAQ